MQNSKKISATEILISTIIFSVIVFGVVLGMGTAMSGWHLVDDHEYLEYAYMVKYQKQSLLDVIRWALSFDTLTRNRFLYYPCKFIMCSIVGANSFSISMVKAGEVVIFMLLLFACAKKICGSYWVSVFFSITCLVGYQSPVWWKLGTEQVQSGICFGIAFFTLLLWIEKPQKKAYAIISILFMLFMGWFHESFVLVMPFLALYPIYEIIREKQIPIKGILKSLRTECSGSWWYTITSLALFVGVILSIVLRLGLSSHSPVSFSKSRPISEYINTLKYTLDIGLKWYWYLGIILTAIILTYYEQIKHIWADILIVLVFALPQFVLYSKEGIVERYIIPIIIGIAMFFILFVYRNGFLSGRRRAFYGIVLLLMLVLNTRGMVVEADYFRFRGEGVTKMLEATADLSQKGYNVMCCLGNANPEADWTVDMYLKSEGLGEIYYLDEEGTKATDVRPWLKNPSARLYDIEDMDVIYAYNRDDRHFTVDLEFDVSDYVYKKCGGLDFYFKKSVVDEIGEDYLERLNVRPTLYGIGE